jgi:hypothetical protein
MVKYRVRYVLDTDTRPIRPDTRIGRVSVKSLFLNKKIISDTRRILPDTRIGKVSVKFLFLNKKTAFESHYKPDYYEGRSIAPGCPFFNNLVLKSVFILNSEGSN